MRRIILGLLLILILGGGVFGATQAFFNDTETSTGNILTAGSIDLTVDHAYASYNDEVCGGDCVEQDINLVTNGGFEEPEVTAAQNWDIFDSVAAGWTIEWRDDISATFGDANRPEPAHLELHAGVLGSASEGDQYAELDSDWNGHIGSLNNEPASTIMYQDIVTVPGRKYVLRFDFAARPNTIAANNRLEVQWDGAVVHDTGEVADNNAGIEWSEVEVEVTASGALTRLQFTDLATADSLGTFLDNVRLFEIICGNEDNQCNLWDEKDLEDDDFFWNFGDIKPGDSGRNVISLHVEDNDAWACILAHDVVDEENTRTEPEEDAGDTTDGALEGELSQFVEVFAWQDDDQDGIFDGGETPLYIPPSTPGHLFNPEGFIPVGDTDVGAFIPAGQTRYIGIAWCVGEMDDAGLATMSCDGSSPALNVAQTDIMSVSITAFAEQVRNNADFQCSNDLLE